MKVTRNTPNQLIIEERPWIAGAALVIMMLVMLGIGLDMILSGNPFGLLVMAAMVIPLLFIFIFVRRVQVVFHRPEGWVEIRRQNIHRRSTVRHSLSEISSASVDTSHSGDSPTHRVILHILDGQSAGDHPLTQYLVSGNGSHRAAEAINDWLAQSRATASPDPAPALKDR